MQEIPKEWEIISRHGNFGGWFYMLFHLVLQWPPGIPSSITIKVRETSTGILYSVTGGDERGCMARLRDRKFD